MWILMPLTLAPSPDVDTDAIDAQLEQGVLSVHIPKKGLEARALPIRKIAIRGHVAGG